MFRKFPTIQIMTPHLPQSRDVVRLLPSTILAVLILLIMAVVRCDSQRMTPPRPVSFVEANKSDPYTPHLPVRAHSYHRAQRIVFFVGIGWHVLGLILFLRSGISAAARDRVEALTQRWNKTPSRVPGSSGLRAPPFVTVACYYLIYSTMLFVWSIPISLAGLAVERKFGFSEESLGLFLKDQLLGLCIAQAITPIVWLGCWLYARRPRTWWLYVWAAIVPLNLAVSVVYPVVVSPLYNRYTPLAAGSLRDHILALAGRAGIHNSRVFVEDTSRRTAHVNAYVAGIGPSTRIVLNDTALRKLPEDQILAMVGHEMGHFIEHHVLISVAFSALGTGVLLALLAVILPRSAVRFGRTFRLRGLQDLAALPLVFLTIYLLSIMGEPIGSAVSRQLEHRADAYGLRLTGLSDATARLMVGFAERDLSDPDPPKLLHLWFGSHPTLKERIAFARGFPPHSTRQ